MARIPKRLAAAVQSADSDAAAEALYALAEFGAAAVPQLAVGLSHPDSEVRTLAAVLLGETEDPVAATHLLKTLSDAEIEYAVMDALAWFGKDDRVVGPLVERLKHPDHEIRGGAAGALGRLGARVALPALVDLLVDPSSYVREEACTALGRLRDARAIPPLTAQLAEGGMQAAAAFALCRIGTPEALAALEILRDHPDAKLREYGTHPQPYAF